jgi:1,4-dihydroxy-2-naphthoate octaprenyltransferase
MAYYDGFFNLKYSLLAFIGLLLLHISVNTFNDYYDYKSGIDLKAKRTPFSGGSGFLVSGVISAKKTFWLATISFILAVPIGIYFILNKGWFLLPIFILGAILVLFYTNFLAKLGLGISELSAGLGLGTLPVLGVYLILNQGFSFSVLFVSIPSGILVCNLLLLNEIPDVDADKIGKRKTLPIIVGKDKAAKIYSGLTLLVYLWIILGVIIKIMPPFTLIALLTLPLASKAIKGSMAHTDMDKLLPAQGANVMIVLLIQFLLGIGYILAKVV